MSKVIIAISALILMCSTSIPRVSCKLDEPPYSRFLDITISNSTTIPFKGHLYTVSKNQTHIHVNTTDNNHQPCDIAINVTRDVTEGRLDVTPTEQEIFIVGTQSVTEDSHYKYTILRVDPTTCSYQSVSIPETNDSRGDYFKPRIVRHRTGTDVFFPSLRNCVPCRLNNDGLRISRADDVPQIPRETTSPGVPFHVRFMDSTNDYFYVYNSHNFSTSVQSTTLKLLDGKDFQTKKERIVDFPVYAVSMQKKSNGDFLGICTKTYDEFMADITAYTDVRCERLNSNLDTTSSFQIDIKHPVPVSSISHEFDEQGNSYVCFAEYTNSHLYIHDRNGKLVKGISMGSIDGRFKHYPNMDPMEFDAYDYWDIKGFLVGDEYCIVTEQVATIYSESLHQVRCIDVKPYVKH